MIVKIIESHVHWFVIWMGFPVWGFNAILKLLKSITVCCKCFAALNARRHKHWRVKMFNKWVKCSLSSFLLQYTVRIRTATYSIWNMKNETFVWIIRCNVSWRQMTSAVHVFFPTTVSTKVWKYRNVLISWGVEKWFTMQIRKTSHWMWLAFHISQMWQFQRVTKINKPNGWWNQMEKKLMVGSCAIRIVRENSHFR